MYKKLYKKFLSLLICLVVITSNLVKADTVIIGSAPGLNNGRTISANTNTSYLQNQFTGPGTLPNSSMTGITPIQGVSVDYSAGQQSVDANGIGYSGPNTTTITSPGVHNQQLATTTGNVGVISNGAGALGNASTTSTSDTGPTVAAEIIPVAGGQTLSSADGTGPGYSLNNPTAGGNAASSVPANTSQSTSQNTSQNAVINSDVIIYKPNDFIQAVKPTIKAPAALVLNATTRQIYFSKGGLTQFPPASLANLVTAAILIANKNLDDVLTVSQTAVTGLEAGAVTAGLRTGDKITVRDAIGAMFVKSCCDVANVVAENIAGSKENFVNVMNQTVKSWGCVLTNFTNPSGLNGDNQVTTTYDVAIMIDKATANPALKIMLQQEKYVLPATAHRGALTLTSSNKLLKKGDRNYYEGISASRMGYTSKAGYTIASEVDYNGQKLIAVVLKANGSQWEDTTKLLNYAKVASLEPTSINAPKYNITFNSAGAAGAAQVQAAQAAQAAATQAAAAGLAQGANFAAGDTVGTWMKDTTGWYFVKADGSKATNEWIRQGGKLYCIDSTGYMVTSWRQMSNGSTYYFDPNTGELRHNTWVNVSTGAYYLQADGTLAKADKGTTKNIVTSVGTYTIDENGKALAKVS